MEHSNQNSSLISLKQHADLHKDASFCGDVTTKDAYNFISENPSFLIDVRTEDEWRHVGVVDIDAEKLMYNSWILAPDSQSNPDFSATLQTIKDKDTPLFFLCRIGVRSFHAANAATSYGFTNCFNIKHGFEGAANIQGQRGTKNGWIADGLPWTTL